ncbi:MAG: alpha/beta hydrolase [Actinobacteria bacterium]|nr:MAG: alpha/beta hydrolase [Actinomycetota bacterium]
MSKKPIVLVPGFWLGGWAWDEVSADLESRGHPVTAVTLPGLESVDTDRSGITFEDHVSAVVDAVKTADGQVVLAVHSGAGGVGYEVSDRVPERIAALVYVDSGAASGPLDPDFEGVELPFPGIEKLSEEENLEGVSEEKLAEFESRAVPEPAGALRGGPRPSNEKRLDVKSVVIATAFTADQYRDAVSEGYTFLADLALLRDLTYIDLPTSHWPMWSKPAELADALAGIADGHD